MPVLSDIELVAQAQTGQIEAIGELYDRYHLLVFRYVMARIGDAHLAEDLTGDVFMRLLTALPHYQVREVPFRAWLYRIASNRLIDYYRKEGRRAVVPLDEAAEDLVAEPFGSNLEQQLTLEQVQSALAQMEATQREVVILRFLNGLSLQETATLLEKTQGAIKALQHRGLAALRRLLNRAEVLA